MMVLEQNTAMAAGPQPAMAQVARPLTAKQVGPRADTAQYSQEQDGSGSQWGRGRLVHGVVLDAWLLGSRRDGSMTWVLADALLFELSGDCMTPLLESAKTFWTLRHRWATVCPAKWSIGLRCRGGTA